MTAPAPDPKRNKDLSRIHIFKKDLGLDDDAYRTLLQGVTGKASARELDAKQRWRVMCEMSKLLNGGKEKPKKKYPGRPAVIPGKEALIGKVEALLTELKKPWAYAHSIAKTMTSGDVPPGVDLLQWCDAEVIRKVVAALEYHRRRQAAKSEKEAG
jgi:phage gp16-like protein